MRFRVARVDRDGPSIRLLGFVPLLLEAEQNAKKAIEMIEAALAKVQKGNPA